MTTGLCDASGAQEIHRPFRSRCGEGAQLV